MNLHSPVMKGYVQKKSPTGFKGFRMWQKRWLVLTPSHLCYFKTEDEKEPQGSISLLDVKSIKYHPMKRVGGRFDVEVVDRIYNLDHEDPDLSQKWVVEITRTVNAARAAESKRLKGRKTVVDKPNTTYSGFQMEFYISKFGPDVIFQDETEDKKLQARRKEAKETIEREFATDVAILAYILKEVLDPMKGSFIYDFSPDSEEAVPIQAILQSNVDKSSRTKELNSGVVGFLIGQHFKRNLSLLLQTQNEAQGLAIRVLWIVLRGTRDRAVASEEFTTCMDINCSGKYFSSHIKQALVKMMLTSPDNIPRELEPLQNIPFRAPVRNTSLWASLFKTMRRSDLDVRNETLRDLNTMFHDNEPNCITIVQSTQWPAMIFHLLTDLKMAYKEVEPTKSSYALTVNVLCVIAFQFLRNSNGFEELLNSLLLSLRVYGNSDSLSAHVAGTMLGALFAKAVAQNKSLALQPHSITLNNLFSLLKITRKFVVQSVLWQDEVVHGAMPDTLFNPNTGLPTVPASPAPPSPSSPSSSSPFPSASIQPPPSSSSSTQQHNVNSSFTSLNNTNTNNNNNPPASPRGTTTSKLSSLLSGSMLGFSSGINPNGVNTNSMINASKGSNSNSSGGSMKLAQSPLRVSASSSNRGGSTVSPPASPRIVLGGGGGGGGLGGGGKTIHTVILGGSPPSSPPSSPRTTSPTHAHTLTNLRSGVHSPRSPHHLQHMQMNIQQQQQQQQQQQLNHNHNHNQSKSINTWEDKPHPTSGERGSGSGSALRLSPESSYNNSDDWRNDTPSLLSADSFISVPSTIDVPEEPEMVLVYKRIKLKGSEEDFNPIEPLKAFGLHWDVNEEGDWIDLRIVQKIVDFFASIKAITSPDQGEKEAEEREMIQQLVREQEWWEDLLLFMRTLNRDHLFTKHQLTRRKVGVVCSELCNSWSKSDRTKTIHELASVLS